MEGLEGSEVEHVLGLAALTAVVLWLRKSGERSVSGSTNRPSVEVPSSITGRGPMTDSYSLGTDGAAIPERRPGFGCWVPEGVVCSIQGRVVTDGLIYVGTGLKSIASQFAAEPALINPKLGATTSRPSEAMGYWPSYADISPEHRGAYLDWLSTGRADPDVELGYVFLFFYGLERRALFDAQIDPAAHAEVPAIRQEITRLLAIYGGSRSFRQYAHGVLDVLEARRASNDAAMPHPVGEPDHELTAWDLRRILAHCAESGSPLPARQALAWLHHDPRTNLRTPGKRCRDEFDALFLTRYAAKYGDGMILKPCKRTVTLSYRPASSGLPVVEVPTALPDILGLLGPHRRLQEIATSCCDDLSKYSRFLGKHPDQRDSLNALALMPSELVRSKGRVAVEQVGFSLDAALGSANGGVFAAKDLLQPWIDGDLENLGKRESVPLIQLLGLAGFGIEPDVRFGGPPLNKSEHVSVFRLGGERQDSASSAYSAAALLLQLAVSVSAADGDLGAHEEQHLQDHLAGSLHLDKAERLRLGAHLQWLLAAPPRLTGLKKRVASLDAEQRRQAALLLVDVAWADGRVDSSEVKMLQRIYMLLELDPESVHGDLHDARQRLAFEDGPVLVKRAGCPAPVFPIPPRPEDSVADREPAEVRPRTVGPGLDHEVIEKKLQQTAAVSSLLASIFSEQDASDPRPVVTVADSGGPTAVPDDLSQLLMRLGSKSSWERSEYEELAQEFGLLPDGALESLNDLAFDRCDDALLEGEDPIEVNLDIHRELVA